MKPLPVLTGVRRKKGGVAAQAIGSFAGPPGRRTVHCPPKCSLVISTAAPQIDHRHIYRLRRTKKSRSHSEPVEVRADPVGPKRAACACQFAKLCPSIKPDGQSAGMKSWRFVLYTSSRPSGLSRPVLATTAFSRLVVTVDTIWAPCQL